MNGSARLWPTKIGEDALIIEGCGDLRFGAALDDEHPVETPDHLDLFRWPRPEHDPVRLQALLLSMIEDRFGLAMLIYEIAA